MSLVELHIPPDRLAEVILNRPEKLNAFSTEMMKDFSNVLGELENAISNDQVRVVLIRSSAAPKSFCAGADLGERVAMSESQVSQTLLTQRSIMDRVAALMVPTIAVIDGIAFGGGLELALSCDLRVASTAAQIGLTETKLAIIPGAGGTQRLRVIVGEAKAKELIFLARRLSAVEALSLGLVNKMSDQALVEARSLANEMLTCGPLALKAAKKSIEAYRRPEFAKQLDSERACYESVLKSQDRVEGLKAFVEKRIPKYLGR
jgi:methylglutaconyl-CoA hydratase